jgi:hypothetical protein
VRKRKQKPAKAAKAKAVKTESEVKNPEKKKKIDLAAMREKAGATAMDAADLDVKIHQTVYPLSKPGSKSYFRVDPRPGYRAQARIVEDDEDGESGVYLIDSAYNPPEDVQTFVKPAILMTCVTTRGLVHVWPLKLSHPKWSQSGMAVAKAAMTQWVRTHLQRSVSGFGIEYAPTETQEKVKPQWPELGLEEILEKAFEGKIIDTDDHPYIRALQGKA